LEDNIKIYVTDFGYGDVNGLNFS